MLFHRAPKNTVRTIQTYCRAAKKEIITLIESGIIYFGVGGALGFDTIAALTVLNLKEKYPQIKLIMVLPCIEQADSWSKDDVKIYNQILGQADKVVYTSEHYHSGCIHKRNRHFADNSSVCICYLADSKGGTAYIVNYAQQKGSQIINISL